MEDCLRIIARQRDADIWLRSIRDGLGITADGWTLTNNYDDTIQQTKLIKEKVLETANDAERVHVQKHWPFDDFDERELVVKGLSICTWSSEWKKEGEGTVEDSE